MIIAVNGKDVGGMTELEFQLELDICGPDVLLVVSRFDINNETVESDGRGENPLVEIAMDWNDIGATIPSVQKTVTFSEYHTRASPWLSDQEQSLNINKDDTHLSSKEQAIASIPASEKATEDENKTKKSPQTAAGTKAKRDVEPKGKAHAAHQIKQKSFKTKEAPVTHTAIRSNSVPTPKDEYKLSFGTRENSAKKRIGSFDQNAQPDSQEEEELFVESEDEDDENPWLGW